MSVTQVYLIFWCYKSGQFPVNWKAAKEARFGDWGDTGKWMRKLDQLVRKGRSGSEILWRASLQTTNSTSPPFWSPPRLVRKLTFTFAYHHQGVSQTSLSWLGAPIICSMEYFGWFYEIGIFHLYQCETAMMWFGCNFYIKIHFPEFVFFSVMRRYRTNVSEWVCR